MLIFYEEEHVKWLLDGGRHNKYVSTYELGLIAIYFRDVVGKSRSQAREDLIDFCKNNNPDFNEVLGRKKINRAMGNSDNYNMRPRLDIVVTKSEMNFITDRLDNYKSQKAAFALLILSKFFSYTEHHKKKRKSRGDENLVWQGMAEILRLIEVHVAQKERYQIIYDLQQSGLIDTKRYGAFEVLFVDELSPTEILVADLNNMVDFFPYYCEECGKMYDRSLYAKNQLCDECYEVKRRKDKTATMKKLREDIK